MTSRTLAGISIAVAGVGATHTAIRRAGLTWGATDGEASQPIPGDELVPNPDTQTTMAISIDCPPEQVWPWLVQMGVDRAGFYSHTWVENGLLHLRVRNADHIHEEWQNLQVGDHFWFLPSRYPTPQFGPQVVAIEPNRHIILLLGDEPEKRFGTWQFVLRPEGESTRLLLRSCSSASRPIGQRMMDFLLDPGYVYMQVGMLRGLAARAEAQVVESWPVASPPMRGPRGNVLTAMVVVASAQGATRGIGRAIATTLGEHGIDAVVRDANAASDISAHDLIVVGSAIHSHHWLPDAVRFIERNSRVLQERNVWLFSSGMLAVDSRQPWPNDYPSELEHLMSMCGAQGHRLFHGRRQMPEPKALWQPMSNCVMRYAIWRGLAKPGFQLTIGDYRDWDAIKAWTREIACSPISSTQLAA